MVWVRSMILAALMGVFIYRVARAPFPMEENNQAYKIFYVHLPCAISATVAFTITFVASIGYLARRTRGWDMVAEASALPGVVMAGLVLVTGSIWARSAWNVWWLWSEPRLVASLGLWLIYVVYVLLRGAIDAPEIRAKLCAVFGVLGFLAMPLVYFSAKLLTPEQRMHQLPRLSSDIRGLVWGWCVPVMVVICLVLIHETWRTIRLEDRIEALQHRLEP